MPIFCFNTKSCMSTVPAAPPSSPRGADSRHNGAGMSLNGSESRPDAPLHPALSLLTAVLGTVAMLVSGLFLARHLPLRVTITTGSILLAVPALLALLLAGRSIPGALALRPLDRRTALLAALLGAALWVASLGLLELQYTVWAPPPGYLEMFRRIHEALRPANAFDAVLSVLAIAAAPAVFEETLVRGSCCPPSVPAWGPRGRSWPRPCSSP